MPTGQCYCASVSPPPRRTSELAPDPTSTLVGHRVKLALDTPGKVAQLRLPADAGGATIPTVFGSVPPETRVGEEVEVFVVTDAKGAPQASLTLPLLFWGEVRFLEVTSETDMGVFVGELAALYEAFVTGAPGAEARAADPDAYRSALPHRLAARSSG